MTLDATEIYPHLYMGSRPPIGPFLARAGVGLLVLAAREFQPARAAFPGVTVVHAPLRDGELSSLEARVAENAANAVVDYLRRGKTVLVSCEKGVNRSGLIIALVLMDLGIVKDAAGAIRLIRKSRSPALTNPNFRYYLYASSGSFSSAACS